MCKFQFPLFAMICANILILVMQSCGVAQTATSIAADAQSAMDRGDFPKWWQTKLPADIERDVLNKGIRLADKLDLMDEVKTRNVATLITEHFSRVWAWHDEVDARLNIGWTNWDAARDNSNGKPKDELKALLIWTEQIEPIYAEFRPQIRTFLLNLKNEIGEQKTIDLLDIITRSPGAKRTYDAYLAMVPELKSEEKEVLWNRMVNAREEAMAAWSDKQIVKIFKLYKVRNELSIDYFGYDYQKRYKEWSSKSAR